MDIFIIVYNGRKKQKQFCYEKGANGCSGGILGILRTKKRVGVAAMDLDTFASEIYDIHGRYAGSYLFWYDPAQGRHLKLVSLDDIAADDGHNKPNNHKEGS